MCGGRVGKCVGEGGLVCGGREGKCVRESGLVCVGVSLFYSMFHECIHNDDAHVHCVQL